MTIKDIFTEKELEKIIKALNKSGETALESKVKRISGSYIIERNGRLYKLINQTKVTHKNIRYQEGFFRLLEDDPSVLLENKSFVIRCEIPRDVVLLDLRKLDPSCLNVNLVLVDSLKFK